MFLCEHLWYPSGANFVIFQCCHYRFLCIEADIQLGRQFPCRNPPICVDQSIKTPFILWCDSCAWPSRMWRVFHTAVTTAETCHPLPHCANIHCLFSVNVQQALMNVIGCNFFHVEELSYTPLLDMCFHVRHHFVRLLVCCHLLHGNKI
jgi:hypothetical protein